MLNNNAKSRLKLVCSSVLLCSVAALSVGCGAKDTADIKAVPDAKKDSVVLTTAVSKAPVLAKGNTENAKSEETTVSKQTESKETTSVAESKEVPSTTQETESKTTKKETAKKTTEDKTVTKAKEASNNEATTSKDEEIDPIDLELYNDRGNYSKTCDYTGSVCVFIKHKYSDYKVNITMDNYKDFLKIPTDGSVDTDLLTFTAVRDRTVHSPVCTHNMFSLTLKNTSKENIIKVVEELEKCEGVIYAQPDYVKIMCLD